MQARLSGIWQNSRNIWSFSTKKSSKTSSCTFVHSWLYSWQSPLWSAITKMSCFANNLSTLWKKLEWKIWQHTWREKYCCWGFYIQKSSTNTGLPRKIQVFENHPCHNFTPIVGKQRTQQINSTFHVLFTSTVSAWTGREILFRTLFSVRPGKRKGKNIVVEDFIYRNPQQHGSSKENTSFWQSSLPQLHTHSW